MPFAPLRFKRFYWRLVAGSNLFRLFMDSRLVPDRSLTSVWVDSGPETP